MAELHDHLLTDALFLLQFNQLLLHVFVFFLLLDDRVRKFFEVGQNIRIHNFYVFVILSGQVVFHQSDFLSEHFETNSCLFFSGLQLKGILCCKNSNYFHKSASHMLGHQGYLPQPVINLIQDLEKK